MSEQKVVPGQKPIPGQTPKKVRPGRTVGQSEKATKKSRAAVAGQKAAPAPMKQPAKPPTAAPNAPAVAPWSASEDQLFGSRLRGAPGQGQERKNPEFLEDIASRVLGGLGGTPTPAERAEKRTRQLTPPGVAPPGAQSVTGVQPPAGVTPPGVQPPAGFPSQGEQLEVGDGTLVSESAGYPEGAPKHTVMPGGQQIKQMGAWKDYGLPEGTTQKQWDDMNQAQRTKLRVGQINEDIARMKKSKAAAAEGKQGRNGGNRQVVPTPMQFARDEAREKSQREYKRAMGNLMDDMRRGRVPARKGKIIAKMLNDFYSQQLGQPQADNALALEGMRQEGQDRRAAQSNATSRENAFIKAQGQEPDAQWTSQMMDVNGVEIPMSFNKSTGEYRYPPGIQKKLDRLKADGFSNEGMIKKFIDEHGFDPRAGVQ